MTVIDDIDQHDKIYIGKSSRMLLWSKGDEIPKASEAMEAYYEAYDAWLEYLPRYSNEASLEAQTEEDLADKFHQLRPAVPEWQ